jgi:hypothetical protein
VAHLTVINTQSIPKELHPLIPLIERWSFSDDQERKNRITTASPEERAEFLAIMRAHREILTAWLQATDVTSSDDFQAIAWLDVAAAELEAIQSRRPRSISRQVVTAFFVLCGCIVLGLLIGFVYFRLTGR